MAQGDRSVARRAALQGAGLGIAAGLVARVVPASAAMPTAASHPAKAKGEIWSGEYTAKKGEVALQLYRKRVGAPKPGAAPLPVLFLVHCSSVSARPSFDLTVPGHGEYSVMTVFAELGYDVWTMDHENYGRSSRTLGNSDIASGVEDLKAGTDLVVRETKQQKLHMFGESSGALRAGAFAMARPERVGRLVFSAFTYKGEGSPTLAKRGEQLAFYQTHNRRPRDRAMILSITTRDKSGTSDPAVAEALADAELVYGNEVPTGTYLDMTSKLPVVDPEKVTAPVLLLRGEYDGIATLEDIVAFYEKLPNGDRQLAVLPNTAHSVVLGINRQLFWHTMHAFLTMPAPVSA
jgi:alpha-beta hydrolase superfamily lysophospholipase